MGWREQWAYRRRNEVAKVLSADLDRRARRWIVGGNLFHLERNRVLCQIVVQHRFEDGKRIAVGIHPLVVMRGVQIKLVVADPSAVVPY
jgi:hypothetical protein